MRTFLLLAVFCILALSPTQAQLDLTFDNSIPVQAFSATLDLAWGGGLNFAQTSDIDLNCDGIKDLFFFDRAGNSVVTLLNNGSPGPMAYSITRAYDNVHPFPELHDWVLLRDYNCDGKEDIFAYTNAGFTVYKNIGAVSYTHLRAHETVLDLVCRLLLEKKKTRRQNNKKKKNK